MVDIKVSLRDEITMRQAAGEQLPSPPYPPLDSIALSIVINKAVDQLVSTASLEEVIVWAVVHGWYEGYLHAVDGPFLQ
jgi:hypothetical protein